jgi:hypothetical protein
MRTIVIVGLAAIMATPASASQDALEAAKDLYASAAYEEALSTLSRLSEGSVAAPMARQVDEYRAFCLFALGRTAEAESVAESLIRSEPLAQLNAADASPRLEAMFAGVRKRMLPALIREQYRTARGLVDQKQYAAAAPRLTEARRMLTEAERLGARDDSLADLSVLIDGFLALSRAQAEAAAAAPAATVAALPPAPPAPAPAPPAPAASSTANGATHIYGIDDADVTPPVTILQRAPSVTVELLTILRTQRRPIILNVTIDETGRVERADVRVSANESYEGLLIRSAMTWRYKPAMRNGVPVRYEKTVVIDVK